MDGASASLGGREPPAPRAAPLVAGAAPLVEPCPPRAELTYDCRVESTERVAAVKSASAERYEPLMPTGLRWMLGFYLGIPLFLLIITSEGEPVAHLFTKVRVLFVSTVAIGGPLQAAYVWLMPRVLARLEHKAARASAHAVAVLGCVALGNVLIAPIFPFICPREVRQDFYDVLIGVSVAAVVVMGTTSYMQLLQRAQAVEQRVQATERTALRAELEALQARTNPHFLFNSLNTVASLIPQDPACAEATLERLCDLFRYTLDSSRRTRVSLERELDITRDYLEVEQLRLGERLRWSLEADPSLAALQVPPLTLQPLVENAVLHGIAQRQSPGELAVRAEVDGADVVLTVENDVPRGRQVEPRRGRQEGNGMALRDLERRLELSFAGRARIEHGVIGERYRVTIRIPREADA
jgi:two-component system, LytTR family, sensor histidine kinase AlgZ